MASYRIVCTEQEPVTEPNRRAHIVAVGTGTDPAKADKRWTLKEVIAAMAQGESFYTKGTTSGKTASVIKYFCSGCNREHIKSSADAVTDNNLDSLRRCSWQS